MQSVLIIIFLFEAVVLDTPRSLASFSLPFPSFPSPFFFHFFPGTSSPFFSFNNLSFFVSSISTRQLFYMGFLQFCMFQGPCNTLKKPESTNLFWCVSGTSNKQCLFLTLKLYIYVVEKHGVSNWCSSTEQDLFHPYCISNEKNPCSNCKLLGH